MPALREHWVPVFDKHHVDLVLQGHDHAYQRTYPLRGHRRASGPDEGTIYVIAVSGDKYVDQAHRETTSRSGLTGVSTYQTIEIDPRAERLTYRAWTEDGRVVRRLPDRQEDSTRRQPRRRNSLTLRRSLNSR